MIECNSKINSSKNFNFLVGLVIVFFLVFVDILLLAHAEDNKVFSDILIDAPQNTALIAAIIAAIATILTPFVGWILSSRFENREIIKIDSLVKQGELLKQLLELRQTYSKNLSVNQMQSMMDELDNRLIFTHENLVNNSIAMEIEKNVKSEVNLESLSRGDIAFLLFKPNSATGWLLAILFYFFLLLIPGTLILIFTFTIDNSYLLLNAIAYGLIMRTIHRTAIRIHSIRILKNRQYLTKLESLKGI